MFYELIAMSGMTHVNKNALSGIKQLLIETVKPETIGDKERETEAYKRILEKEMKEDYKLTFLSDDPMSDGEIASAFNS